MHLAPGAEHAHDGRQQGGLAGAIGADHRHDLALADRQAGVAQRFDFAIGHAQALDLQHGVVDLVARREVRFHLHVHHSTPPR
ncbi:hypothetical protein D3C86_1645370 [compost metagenome]